MVLERWNLVQAILWVWAAPEHSDDVRELISTFASAADRDDPSLALTLMKMQRSDPVAVRTKLEVPGVGQTEVFIRGSDVSAQWTAATKAIVDAVHSGALSIWGRRPGADERQLISPDLCESLLFREDFTGGPYACLSFNNSHTWLSLRFLASELMSQWPAAENETELRTSTQASELACAGGEQNKPRRGRPKGSGYQKKDAPLVERVRQLVESGQAKSYTEAARSIVADGPTKEVVVDRIVRQIPKTTGNNRE